MTVLLPLLAQLALPVAPAGPVALFNCSLPGGMNASFFVADGAQLKWKADPSLCLAPSDQPGATAALLLPCAGRAGWSRTPDPTGGAGFFLSPADNASLCLRAQPSFSAALVLPCFADPWNGKLMSLGHSDCHGGAGSNPCCDKVPCGSAVCNKTVCAACTKHKSAGVCPQSAGTAWHLLPDGTLQAAMSNPFMVPGLVKSCTHFWGCLRAPSAAPSQGALQPLRWQPPPLSTPLSPTPEGWLHRQLLAQRNGFGGHELPMAHQDGINNVYNDIWLGGKFASGGGGHLAEGYPYWLNGFVPLARLLNDSSYVATLQLQIHQIITNASAQKQGGWLGPLYERSRGLNGPYSARGYDDFWLQYRMLGAVAQAAESATSVAAREAIIAAMVAFTNSLDALLDTNPIFVGDWSHSRMNELLSPLLWLADHASPAANLTATFRLLGKFSTQGFDWATWILSGNLPAVAGELCGSIHYQRLPVHGVDIGTGLMQEAHMYRITGKPEHLVRAKAQLSVIMSQHGQANGVFGANECLSDRDPTHGTETCVVVEMMESLAQMFTVSGDLEYIDQLEQIALNAMPAPFFNGTMGAMKYFQEINHPGADKYSQVYECCLTNHNMGWPKYAQRAVMTAKESTHIPGDTLGVLLYHPFEAESIVLPSGATAGVSIKTDYPFDNAIHLNFTSATAITVALRIPGWCPKLGTTQDLSEVCRVERSICKSPSSCHTRVDPCRPSDFFRTVLGGSTFGSTAMTLHLPMQIRLENRTQGAVAVHRGPILYSKNVAWIHNQSRECAASGLFPKAFSTPNGSFLCDVNLTPREDLLPESLSVSNATTFTFVKPPTLTTMPTPQPGQGVFSSFLTPLEVKVSGAGPRGDVNFSMIPYGATDLRITELQPIERPPPLPPPIVFPTTSLIIDGPVGSDNGKSNSKTGCSAQLPTIPCWFNHWGRTGNPAGPSVTDNSGKDHGFTVLRSGSPHHVSVVQVYPQILATAAHSLKFIEVEFQYMTGYTTGAKAPIKGVDVEVSLAHVGSKHQLPIYKRANLTGFAFDDCHPEREACYSPVQRGKWAAPATSLGGVEGLMQVQISFTNHDLNVQLLLPVNFTLAWS